MSSDDFIILEGVLKDYCGESTKVVIPESVVQIEPDVFAGMESITTVILPEGLKSYGRRRLRSAKI